MRKSSERGFVLVAVIWLAGLIASISAGFAVKVRIDALVARAAISGRQMEALSDGLAQLTAWQLATAEETADPAQLTRQCKLSGGAVASILVQDQAGLVDLNTMPTAFFVEFFRKVGADQKTASKLAGELEDFRDIDKVDKNGGQEPQLYSDQSFGPKNSPFQAIEEIDQLPGMTEPLYRAALPYLTVYSSQYGIDPITAPPNLRRLFKETHQGTFSGALAPYVGAQQGKTFSIDVEVTSGFATRFHRRAIAVLLQQPDKPYLFLEWRTLVTNDSTIANQDPALKALKSCY